MSRFTKAAELARRVLGTNRGARNKELMEQMRMNRMLPNRAQNLAETVLRTNPASKAIPIGAVPIKNKIISDLLSPKTLLAGTGVAGALKLSTTDPNDLGREMARMNMTLQQGFDTVSQKAIDIAEMPQIYFMEVEKGYKDEMQRQKEMQNIEEFGSPVEPIVLPPEEEGLKPVSLMFAEGGEIDMSYEAAPLDTLNMQMAQLSADSLANTIIPGIPNGVTKEDSFEDAFQKARQALGPGMIFMYKLQGEPNFKRYTTDFKEEVERKNMQEGGELDMQGDMMQPQMQPEMPMGEVSQMEVQEAQQGLVQILQVIETLIQQGLSEDEIIAFLAQYGITEAELEQAAQVLGVDMAQLLGGAQMEQPQMEVPQQPMMMANGGALSNQDIAIAQSMLTPDNEPMFQSRSPEGQIFSLNNRIENLMTSYEMLLRNNEFERAQEVADQIDEVQQQIIAIQSQNIQQMGMGLGQKKN